MSNQPIPLYWWVPGVEALSASDPAITQSHFGDALSKFIVEHISGRPTVHSTNPGKLLAVGSVLWMAKDGDIVWGSGVTNDQSWSIPKTKNLFIRAVRGPLTRELLLAHGIFCPSIYGDPATLISKLYYSPVVEERDWGLIPHIGSLSEPQFKKYKDQIIDVRWDWKRVIDTITRCKLIVSSSLHGLIVAESYGIPAIWLKADGIDDFEYHDYYACTGRSIVPATTVEEALSRPLNTYIPRFDTEPLLREFPFPRPKQPA